MAQSSDQGSSSGKGREGKQKSKQTGTKTSKSDIKGYWDVRTTRSAIEKIAKDLGIGKYAKTGEVSLTTPEGIDLSGLMTQGTAGLGENLQNLMATNKTALSAETSPLAGYFNVANEVASREPYSSAYNQNSWGNYNPNSLLASRAQSFSPSSVKAFDLANQIGSMIGPVADVAASMYNPYSAVSNILGGLFKTAGTATDSLGTYNIGNALTNPGSTVLGNLGTLAASLLSGSMEPLGRTFTDTDLVGPELKHDITALEAGAPNSIINELGRNVYGQERTQNTVKEGLGTVFGMLNASGALNGVYNALASPLMNNISTVSGLANTLNTSIGNLGLNVLGADVINTLTGIGANPVKGGYNAISDVVASLASGRGTGILSGVGEIGGGLAENVASQGTGFNTGTTVTENGSDVGTGWVSNDGTYRSKSNPIMKKTATPTYTNSLLNLATTSPESVGGGADINQIIALLKQLGYMG